MDIKSIQEILACFSQDKTVFCYGKDQYAVFLLSEIIGDTCTITVLKQSVFTKLLNTPLVQALSAKAGDGRLSKDRLHSVWPKNAEAFLLTLGVWGSNDRNYDQTSRDGYSLVLQLNFCHQHDRLFDELTRPKQHCFNYHAHPVLKRQQRAYFRETLAWARLDADFKHNEVLIEELQTDWLRTARDIVDDYRRGRLKPANYGTETTPEKLNLYARKVLDTYGNLWQEAMLTAALQFSTQELGIRDIYMHTPDTGAAIKRIRYSQPPRSLYSDLPKKFCFRQTNQAPRFIAKTKQYRKLEQELGGTLWNHIYLGDNYVNNIQTA